MPNTPLNRKVERYYEAKSQRPNSTDNDAGWVEWSDGTQEEVFDLSPGSIKKDTGLTDSQIDQMRQQFKETIPGLSSMRQIELCYLGISEALHNKTRAEKILTHAGSSYASSSGGSGSTAS